MAGVTGLAVGLALSPLWPSRSGLSQLGLLVILFAAAIVRRGRIGTAGALAISMAALLLGLGLGAARLDSIESGALRLESGSKVTLEGFVISAPSRSRGMTRMVVETGGGKVLFESPDSALVAGDDSRSVAAAMPGTGSGVIAEGVIGPAPDWLEGQLKRQGVSMVLHASRVDLTGFGRDGFVGVIDRMRSRGEVALGTGMPAREVALAKGFVLGQDDTIDQATEAEFRNSGLAHLLAVSGQNVVLLGLLLAPILALSGIGLRKRLVVIAALIALYVPLAGGGASIQRAGAMGIAGLVATAASRPSSRLYGLLVAAFVTLLVNPLATTDIGWQLRFAAVSGIYLLVRPLSDRMGGGPDAPSWRGPVSEAAAITTAATVATAPLMAFHFGQIPVATLLANLLAAPAVAPAMWLGMISAGVGQLDASLALPFNLVNTVALAYIAQVAHWFGSPGWAVVDIDVGGVFNLVAIYCGIAVLVLFALKVTGPNARSGSNARFVLAAAAVVAGLLLFTGGDDRRQLADPPQGGARIEIFDVGQGDAILLRPDQSDPVLVDAGPPDGDVVGALESAGVDDLSAVLVTHNHLDHFGGAFDVVGDFDPERLFFDHAPADLLSAARSAGVQPIRVSAGDRLSFGDLAIEILWPPDSTGPPSAVDEDPNSRSIVGLLEWRKFRMLLTGDAEADMAPLDPGPLDVLKVAHHGSEDQGLEGLLARSSPTLSVISVGEDNGYGHPDRSTLEELTESGSQILRTDIDGTVSIVLSPKDVEVESGR